jgi:hypothetical protein
MADIEGEEAAAVDGNRGGNASATAALPNSSAQQTDHFATRERAQLFMTNSPVQTVSC